MMDNDEVVQGEVVLMMQDRKMLNARRTKKLQELQKLLQQLYKIYALQNTKIRKHQTRQTKGRQANIPIYLNILETVTQTILDYLQLDAAMTQMLDNVEENAPDMHRKWIETRIALNTKYERKLANLYQYRERKQKRPLKGEQEALAILTQTIMNYLKLDKMLMLRNVNAEELMTIRRDLNLSTTEQLEGLLPRPARTNR